MAVSGPVIVHMFIILSRDAILDLSAFMSLKKILVLLFMALKNLSTCSCPNTPRQYSSLSSRKTHEYHGLLPRRLSARLRKRSAFMELLDHDTLIARSFLVSTSIAAYT